jgi:hypothetical protein
VKSVFKLEKKILSKLAKITQRNKKKAMKKKKQGLERNYEKQSKTSY